MFVRHRERLSTQPKLYKRWERFVFNKPVEEDDDLLNGLDTALLSARARRPTTWTTQC